MTIIVTVITGCALPTVEEDLNTYVGTIFTNKKYPPINIFTKNSYVSIWKKGENIYYKKNPKE
jgi:hypothetical protein